MAKPSVRAAPSPHPESHTPWSSALQVEAVRPVPVAIDDVHSAVAVEVSQRHTASVLVGVIQPWGTARAQGETGTPLCLLVPSTPPRMGSIVPRQVLHVLGLRPCADGCPDASQPLHSGHWGSGFLGLCVCPPPRPTLIQSMQGQAETPLS